MLRVTDNKMGTETQVEFSCRTGYITHLFKSVKDKSINFLIPRVYTPATKSKWIRHT